MSQSSPVFIQDRHLKILETKNKSLKTKLRAYVSVMNIPNSRHNNSVPPPLPFIFLNIHDLFPILFSNDWLFFFLQWNTVRFLSVTFLYLSADTMTLFIKDLNFVLLKASTASLGYCLQRASYFDD